MEALQEALINFLVVVIGLVATFVGQKGYSYLNNKGILKEIEAKQKYVNIVVNAIQQTYKEANGEEKLGEAKTQLVDFFLSLYTSPSPRDATLSRMPSSA